MKQRRMTKQKKLILQIAKSHLDHPTADQLYLEMRDAGERISRATVYRNLEQLSETGELLHVKLPGADRFDSRTEYHYHILCTSCGALYDMPWDYRYDIDEKVTSETGFQVERHRTNFEGICPHCQQKAALGCDD